MATSAVLRPTLDWLQESTTWAAVFLPAAVTAIALFKERFTRNDLLLLGLSVLAGIFSAHLEAGPEYVALYGRPWACWTLLVGAGLRLYLPGPLKAYALCWLSALTVDFAVMAQQGATVPSLELPLGIGGAGFGDALFIEPTACVLGLLLLSAARHWDNRRKATALS